ncbi:hypothetical protein QCD75_09390 [Arthrobacter sp. PsM3]|nr:hypothetical protein [Arthrobacter sp. PsM3]MDN4644201.1 hypothetical protein [Arthrobacter sp. PsM3]
MRSSTATPRYRSWPTSSASPGTLSGTHRPTRSRYGHPNRGPHPHVIRRTPQIGAEHLTEEQASRLDAKLTKGDPNHEVTLAWQRYQKLRNFDTNGASNGPTEAI